MDMIQDWILHFLSTHENLRAYTPHIGRAYGYLSALKTWTTPLLTKIATQPDLVTLALLLIIVFVSLKILNMLYQTFLFWLRMAFRVLFWGGLGALALWMYHRGPEGVVEDVGYWSGVWGGEMEYWRERERVARMTGQQRGAGKGAGARWY